MKKSNIALAIVAGAVIGGAVALVLQAKKVLDEEEGEIESPDNEEEEAHPAIENIARQFSDRISSELQAAEEKIRSAVKKDPDLHIPEGEHGIFL